jgi:hypothetical protein
MNMDENKTKSESIKTILTITLGFLIVYIISGWKWWFNIALIIGMVGLLSNYLAGKIHFTWMKLTWVLSLIIPTILLAILFYLFLSPIAFLSRLFGEKNQLSLKNTEKSLFKSYNKDFDKRSFEKTW